MSMRDSGLSLMLALGLGASAVQAEVVLFQPDSATASSEFSAFYDIGNVIDGSGLPANFTPDSAHASYSTHNHWTTAAGQVPGVSASFFFDTAATIGSMYLWNHRSNNIAANPHYAVTQFDLVLRDGDGDVLSNLAEQVALPNIATAQGYAWAPIAGVRQVDFIINRNLRFDLGNSAPNYTGIAEIAFSAASPVPVPASVWLLGGALAGLVTTRRRHGQTIMARTDGGRAPHARRSA